VNRKGRHIALGTSPVNPLPLSAVRSRTLAAAHHAGGAGRYWGMVSITPGRAFKWVGPRVPPSVPLLSPSGSPRSPSTASQRGCFLPWSGDRSWGCWLPARYLGHSVGRGSI